MEPESHEFLTMKVFSKGQVVIPVALRKRYRIEIGDQIDIESTNDGILLKPKSKKNAEKNLTQQLYGIFSKNTVDRSGLTPEQIQRSTERGFSEGWEK